MIIPAGRAEYAPHPAAANSGTVPPAQWPQNNASALAIFHVTLSPHSIFWNSPSLQPAVILDWPDRHGTPLCKQEELGLPGLQPHTTTIIIAMDSDANSATFVLVKVPQKLFLDHITGCFLMNTTKVFSDNFYSKAPYELKLVPYFH